MIADYFAALGGGARWPETEGTAEATTRYHLLVATGHKKDKGTGADALREQWGESHLAVAVSQPDDALWQPIADPVFDLAILPPCSFSLRFTFTLAQPYISRDDNAFYIVDNPIVRDRLFGLPLVRPSSWKGNLTAALRQRGQRDDSPIMQRLLGKVSEADDAGQAGRLIFFPTFFTRTGLEIINPHNRKTKVGNKPILFESVPIGVKGVFTLLYVPFDRMGQDEAGTRRQLAEDLSLLVEGMQGMFCTYGFSAKRTSGFGLAQDTVEKGELRLGVASLESKAAPAPVSAPASKPLPDLPRYLTAPGRLKPEYLDADGAFRTRSEAELNALKKADRQEFDKARKWWEREGKTLAAGAAAEREPIPPKPAEAPPPAFSSFTFPALSELVSLADRLAGMLGQGGDR